MLRRSFLLGTMASGLGFIAKEFIPEPQFAETKLTPVEKLNRYSDAFRCKDDELLQFRILYQLDSDKRYYAMPKIEKS